MTTFKPGDRVTVPLLAGEAEGTVVRVRGYEDEHPGAVWVHYDNWAAPHPVAPDRLTLLPPPSPWIPVTDTDRLPPVGTIAFTVDVDMRVDRGAYQGGIAWLRCKEGPMVTHWMHIAPLPGEVENG